MYTRSYGPDDETMQKKIQNFFVTVLNFCLELLELKAQRSQHVVKIVFFYVSSDEKCVLAQLILQNRLLRLQYVELNVTDMAFISWAKLIPIIYT